MRIKIDIECTPAEARAFVGLPDVAPLQRAALEGVAERLAAAAAEFDAEALMKTWLGAGMERMESWQKAFFGGLGKAKKGEDDG